MELPIRLSKEAREPIYHQIEGQIKALIASGQLPEGSPLPSIRVLSKDLGISVITTRRAYQDLEYQGFIETVQGKGTFVAAVEETRKDRVKMETVFKAIEKAVETARRHDYTIEEIEEVFQQVMTELKGREE